jgi:hypothetical protein
MRVPLPMALDADADPTAGGVFHGPEAFAKLEDFSAQP